VAVLGMRKDRRMSDYLGAPRFRVTEIEGYAELAGGSKYQLTTSFHIVDRAYCCAIVWQNRVRKGGCGPLWVRRAKAHAKCAALNAQ
jgi:hypothetical protein